jgi:hypothetical protein
MNSQSGTLSSNPVTLTDQANGLLLINNSTASQEAQRPILELPILALNTVDPSADWSDVWDSSAVQMVRVPALRASQLTYKADGLNDTRAGDLGTITSGIYAVHDHIHPILALTIVALPNVAVVGSGGAFVSQSVNRQRATEETMVYALQVTVTNTASVTWLNLTPPVLPGFYLSQLNNYAYDSSSVNLAPYYGVHPTFVWAGTVIYERPRANGLNQIFNIGLEYILN